MCIAAKVSLEAPILDGNSAGSDAPRPATAPSGRPTWTRRKALGKVQAAAERVSGTLAPKINLWANPEPTALRQLRAIAGGKTDG